MHLIEHLAGTIRCIQVVDDGTDSSAPTLGAKQLTAFRKQWAPTALCPKRNNNKANIKRLLKQTNHEHTWPWGFVIILVCLAGATGWRLWNTNGRRSAATRPRNPYLLGPAKVFQFVWVNNTVCGELAKRTASCCVWPGYPTHRASKYKKEQVSSSPRRLYPAGEVHPCEGDWHSLTRR